MDALPPVLPHRLAAIHTNKLWKMIHPHHIQLKKTGWRTSSINQIEEDHCELQHAASSEAHFQELLGRCSDIKADFAGHCAEVV